MARKVDTATLIRGQIYIFRHPDYTPQNPKESLRFERNKPKVITDPKLLSMLEDLTEETTDGDGEVFDKPLFRINRNVEEPDSDDAPRKTRLSADRAVKKRPIRR